MFGGMSFGLWLPWIIAFVCLIAVWYVGVVVWGRILKEEQEEKGK